MSIHPRLPSARHEVHDPASTSSEIGSVVVRRSPFIRFFLVLLLASTLAHAGKLDDLEKEASGEEHGGKSGSGSSTNSGSGSSGAGRKSGDHGFFASLLGEILTDMISKPHPEKEEYRRPDPPPPEWAKEVLAVQGDPFSLADDSIRKERKKREDIEREEFFRPFDPGPGYSERRLGSPFLPMAQVGFMKTYFDDIDEFRARITLGWGPLALRIVSQQLNESGRTRDTMTIVALQMLARLRPSARTEIDLGLGYAGMRGDSEHDGFNLSLQASYAPCRYWLLRADPQWSFLGGHATYDHELTISCTPRFVTGSIGWRWFGAGTVRWSGPTLGVAFSL